MPAKDVMLLVLVAAIWGLNFVAIKTGLKEIPPITFSAVRFFAVAFPAVLFVRRPALSLRQLAAFGLLMFAGQFALLFSAMHVGLSAGLASLLLQTQAFFTVGLAALVLREKPHFFQIIGTAVAALGVVIVAERAGGDATAAGLCLVLLAALAWGGGNVLTKTFGNVDMSGVIVWGSLFSWPPLLLLAWFLEGDAAILQALRSMNGTTFLSLAYVVYVSTFVAFTIWTRMLTRHSAGAVAPFTLLVPAFGMLSAALLLGEAYPMWKFSSTALIIFGLGINQFGAKIRAIMLEWLGGNLANRP